MTEYEVVITSGSMNFNLGALRGMLNEYAALGYVLVAVTVMTSRGLTEMSEQQIFYLRKNAP